MAAPPSTTTYLYRCTRQQLEEHLVRVAEAGDTVEHMLYEGGRDYVLVCRAATQVPTVALDQASIDALAAALALNPASAPYAALFEDLRAELAAANQSLRELGASVQRSASQGTARGDV